MKVLILGGTGAMGIHLVRNLSNNDVETFVTSRKKHNSEGNIKYIQGNAQNLDFLKAILNIRYDAIVDFMVYKTDSFKERVNFLLEATKQYVFISSARVYANSKQPITETSLRLLDVCEDKNYLTTDDYALTKARQEDILINSNKNNWTIIRPYITYSENRLQLGVMEKEDWFYRALNGRTIIFPKELLEKTSTLTYGLDVVKKIISTIGNVKAMGEIYHITTTESFTWRYILETYLDIIKKYTGQKAKVKYIEFNSSYRLKNYQLIYDRQFDRIFDNTKILKISNQENFIVLKEGLDICVKKIIENRDSISISWVNEAIKDRYTKEFTKLREIKSIKHKVQYLLYRLGIFNV